jgi:hypothetical protein
MYDAMDTCQALFMLLPNPQLLLHQLIFRVCFIIIVYHVKKKVKISLCLKTVTVHIDRLLGYLTPLFQL